MPRAENRKRPPNRMGNTSGGAFAKSNDTLGGKNTQPGVQAKKDALLEKMRKLQEKNKQGDQA